VQDLIAFWSYALAACAFAGVVVWRARRGADRSDKLMLAACFGTAAWAAIAAVWGRLDPATMTSSNIRNLLWVMLLYDMAGRARIGRANGLKLVFSAVALSIGLHLALSLVALFTPLTPDQFADVLTTGSLLRITSSAGALVLVHNIYGQAAGESRLKIRGPMLGLTLMWGYDLNLATLAYFQGTDAYGVDFLFRLRGLFMLAVAPLFAIAGSTKSSLKVRLSRAATFQSLSLVAIAGYLALMAVLAEALRHSAWDWGSAASAGLLLILTAVAALLVCSRWVRGWMKVKLAKHLFEHRYDYRGEWLRFTDMLGRSSADAPPLSERIVQALADIVEAPGGLLLVSDAGGSLSPAAEWNWRGPNPPTNGEASDFWASVEACGRILEVDSLRHGWASARDQIAGVPQWILGDEQVWIGVPLIHRERLTGIVLLAPPEYRRALDWEDFDLLRTAGRQAASSLAEAQGQEALANAQRFEEFNRRFAFILHDVKNLVSQLSLLSRNAERHADNPDFRADMVATLKGSVGKMNDLLARLSPQAASRVQNIEAQSLRPSLLAAITSKRRDHDVRLMGDADRFAVIDAAALEQAIGHLVQNAVEASTEGQQVTVRVSHSGDQLSVAIADRGKGMDAEFLRNRLFQPFVSTKNGGFGIGAFEARSLIAAMNGRLSVSSRPGRGTTFTIVLPAAEPAAETELQPQRKRA
jgi:putative PEP-CTERM system histidine kinase